MKLVLSKSDLERDPNLFDWACANVRAPGSEIVVEPGSVAVTRGTWAFPEHGYLTVASDVTLRMTGAELRLSADAVRTTNSQLRPERDLNVLWLGAGALVVGGRFDGRFADHPGWNVSGLRFYGRYHIEGAEIIGLSGNRSVKESFAISSEGATGGSVVRNVRVHSCNESADAYVSGIYVGGTTDNGSDSLVENCSVNLGWHGQFAYSSTYATRFRNCYGKAARYWYTDTGPGRAVIENGSGELSYAIVSSVCTDNQRREIRVIGGEYQCPLGRAIEWHDMGGEHQGGFVIFRDVKADVRWNVASVAKRGTLLFHGGTIQFRESHVAPGSPEPIYI